MDTQGERTTQSRLWFLHVVQAWICAVADLLLRSKVVHLVERIAAVPRMREWRVHAG